MSFKMDEVSLLVKSRRVDPSARTLCAYRCAVNKKPLLSARPAAGGVRVEAGGRVRKGTGYGNANNST